MLERLSTAMDFNLKQQEWEGPVVDGYVWENQELDQVNLPVEGSTL